MQTIIQQQVILCLFSEALLFAIIELQLTAPRVILSIKYEAILCTNLEL